MTPDAEAVRRLIARINDVWQVSDPERIAELLRPCFSEEMTIAGPGFAAVGTGREACVASYADFARIATVAQCEIGEPVIHVDAGTAVATYRWRIRYTLEGADYSDTGHDVFVLRREGEQWLATWRAMLPDPPPSS